MGRFPMETGLPTAEEKWKVRCHGSSQCEQYSSVPHGRGMVSKYRLVIYWSEEDRAFLVEIPELAGCMADGATYQEAVADAEGIIEEWLETARDLGRPIPAPRRRLLYA